MDSAHQYEILSAVKKWLNPHVSLHKTIGKFSLFRQLLARDVHPELLEVTIVYIQ